MRYNKTNRITKVQFLPTTCRAWSNTKVTKNGGKKKKNGKIERKKKKILMIADSGCSWIGTRNNSNYRYRVTWTSITKK